MRFPVLVALLVFALGAGADELRTDGGSRYVHRTNLYDADGRIINPDQTPAEPYSVRRTCGKCHDYAAVARGWHFNAGAGGPAGRPGEPHVLYDPRTRTWLPLSYRDWPGVWNPEALGMTPWDFTLRFGPQRPGGDVMEPPGEPEMGTRWFLSGKLEIDCLICHSGDNSHDPNERAQQVGEHQNLKWAPTVAAGLGITRGFARLMPDDYDPLLGPNPDRPEWSGPALRYDKGRFNPDHRVYLNITRNPGPDRCLFCHTTREVERNPAHPHDQDVHLALGMTCISCHRNHVDHQITRGDGSAQDLEHDAGNATLSCRGCHLGESPQARAGRLGAPRPLHPGLPAFHLEKISCTACHAGPWPQAETPRVMTSLAHGLGLSTEEDRRPLPPHVLAPVFLPNEQGEIAPHKLFWPAFWARRDGETLTPIPPEEVARAGRGLLSAPPKGSTAPIELADETILAVLAALSPSPDGPEAVYARDGRIHRRFVGDGSPELVAEAHAGAAPVAWPLAHNVRPAGYALGAGGCSDCHAGDAAFFYGRVGERPMHAEMGIAAWTIPLGNLAVWARESVLAEAVALGVLGVILLALLHFAFLSRRFYRPAPPPTTLPWALAWLRWVGLAGLAVLAATGAGFILNYGQWRPGFFAEAAAVRLHVVVGIAFGAAALFVGLAWLKGRRGADWRGAQGLFWTFSAGPPKLAWPGLDLVIFWTLAVTGATMALRPASLPGWLSISYALHGVAALAAMLRLAWYLYLRWWAPEPPA